MQSRCLRISLRYLVLLLLVSLITGLLVSLPHNGPSLPLCSRFVVFTGPRQGSTWFIDSLEQCKYSLPASGDAPYVEDVFNRTEVWVHFGEKEHESGYMDGGMVVEYIKTNGSVKVFPRAFRRRRKELELVVKRREQYGIRLVVLRREIGKTWKSFKRAQLTGVWNGKGSDRDVPIEKRDKIERKGPTWEAFVRGRKRYEEGVETMLKEAGVSVEKEVDVLYFDKIKDMEWIELEKAGCVLRNCNYMDRM